MINSIKTKFFFKLTFHIMYTLLICCFVLEHEECYFFIQYTDALVQLTSCMYNALSDK